MTKTLDKQVFIHYICSKLVVIMNNVKHNISKFEVWCSSQHIKVNQKYGSRGHKVDYDFHLKCVVRQSVIFQRSLRESMFTEYDRNLITLACLAHDILEDTHNTYNDLIKGILGCGFTDKVAETVAEIVYLVTDEKGRNREERKNENYYHYLRQNKLAVFVKLCDITANMLYGRLTGSPMYYKYQQEIKSIRSKLYTEDYHSIFKYINQL